MHTVQVDLHDLDYQSLAYYADIRGVSVGEYVRLIAGLGPVDMESRIDYYRSMIPVKNYILNAVSFYENSEGILQFETIDKQIRTIPDNFIPLLEDIGIIKKKYA